MEHGLRRVEVYVKGPGEDVRPLSAHSRVGLEVTLIKDVTPIPHKRLPTTQKKTRLADFISICEAMVEEAPASAACKHPGKDRLFPVCPCYLVGTSSLDHKEQRL